MLPNLKETFPGHFLCLYLRYDKVKVSGTKLATKYNVAKPANKKQVLFSKTFLPKKSITNKPAFFIWFAKIYFHFRLLIYFHYSCIINSQKLIKSCYLCNLTRFPFCLFLSDKVIYRIPTFFLHNQTSHCFKSYLSKC